MNDTNTKQLTPTQMVEQLMNEVYLLNRDGKHETAYGKMQIELRSLAQQLEAAQKEVALLKKEVCTISESSLEILIERDKLIEVADKLAIQLQEATDSYYEEGFNPANFEMALLDYNSLPHKQTIAKEQTK